jgi:hypothetical protein
VGEDAQDELAPLRLMAACGEGGSEATLVLAEAAFDVPALVIKDARKVLVEGSPVGRLRPAPPGVSSVQGNDAALDAEFIAAETMVVLSVVASIGQNRAQRHERSGLAHSGCEIGRVLTGTDAGDSADDQMRVGVENCGELGPGSLPMARAFALAATFAEVLTDVSCLQSGRVHRGDR